MTHREGHTASSPLSAAEYDQAIGAPTSTRQGDTSAQKDGAGVAYVIRDGKGYLLDGTPYLPIPDPPRQPAQGRTFEQDLELANTPRVSYSSSTSQSLADPASLAIQRDSLAEQIRQAMAQEAKDRELLTFQRDKLRVETEAGDKNRAIDTQRLMEQVQSRLDASAFKRQELQTQIVMAERQIQARAAESAADRSLTARENAANRQLRASEAAQADKLARDKAAAEYAASPTDIGKMSAILASGGQSNISTALGQGDTAITDEALAPLAELLFPGASTTVQSAPPALLNAVLTPEQRLAADQARGSALATTINAGIDPNAAGVGMRPTRTLADDQARGQSLANAINLGTAAPPTSMTAMSATRTPEMEHGGAVVGNYDTEGEGEAFLNGLMRLVQHLGMEPKAVAGEKGKANGETVYSNGDVVVMPDKGEGMPEMEMGGFAVNDPVTGPMGAATGGTGTLGDTGAPATASAASATAAPFLNPRLQMTRDWLSKAQQMTLQRSGFDRAPTPIEFADPGTDPYRAQLAAAVTAQLKGINPQSFLNEAMRLRPQGMQRGYASRTR